MRYEFGFLDKIQLLIYHTKMDCTPHFDVTIKDNINIDKLYKAVDVYPIFKTKLIYDNTVIPMGLKKQEKGFCSLAMCDINGVMKINHVNNYKTDKIIDLLKSYDINVSCSEKQVYRQSSLKL